MVSNKAIFKWIVHLDIPSRLSNVRTLKHANVGYLKILIVELIQFLNY